MLFPDYQQITRLKHQLCIGTINIYISPHPCQLDYELAEQSAKTQAEQKFGKEIDVVAISEIGSQIIFVVLNKDSPKNF